MVGQVLSSINTNKPLSSWRGAAEDVKMKYNHHLRDNNETTHCSLVDDNTRLEEEEETLLSLHNEK